MKLPHCGNLLKNLGKKQVSVVHINVRTKEIFVANVRKEEFDCNSKNNEGFSLQYFLI